MGVSRETLYDEVWAEPMTKVAARYRVSSSFLARVCERLNVPRPSRGHWARLEAGNASLRPGLPVVRPGDEVLWLAPGERPPASLPEPPRDVAPRRLRRWARPDLHPLLVGVREVFVAVKEPDGGYLRPLLGLRSDAPAWGPYPRSCTARVRSSVPCRRLGGRYQLAAIGAHGRRYARYIRSRNPRRERAPRSLGACREAGRAVAPPRASPGRGQTIVPQPPGTP